jgi:hypothetical protein
MLTLSSIVTLLLKLSRLKDWAHMGLQQFVEQQFVKGRFVKRQVVEGRFINFLQHQTFVTSNPISSNDFFRRIPAISAIVILTFFNSGLFLRLKLGLPVEVLVMRVVLTVGDERKCSYYPWLVRLG